MKYRFACSILLFFFNLLCLLFEREKMSDASRRRHFFLQISTGWCTKHCNNILPLGQSQSTWQMMNDSKYALFFLRRISLSLFAKRDFEQTPIGAYHFPNSKICTAQVNHCKRMTGRLAENLLLDKNRTNLLSQNASQFGVYTKRTSSDLPVYWYGLHSR